MGVWYVCIFFLYSFCCVWTGKRLWQPRSEACFCQGALKFSAKLFGSELTWMGLLQLSFESRWPHGLYSTNCAFGFYFFNKRNKNHYSFLLFVGNKGSDWCSIQLKFSCRSKKPVCQWFFSSFFYNDNSFFSYEIELAQNLIGFKSVPYYLGTSISGWVQIKRDQWAGRLKVTWTYPIKLLWQKTPNLWPSTWDSPSNMLVQIYEAQFSILAAELRQNIFNLIRTFLV